MIGEYWNCVTMLFRSGGYAIVDLDDYEKFGDLHWQENIYGRATRSFRENGRQHTKLMYRIIMQAPAHLDVDHINHNIRDNRKCNLRLATAAENSRNLIKYPKYSSPYKGVCWHKNNKIWQATIKVNYKIKYLGSFRDPKDAAIAYNAAALKYHGEFATLNPVGIL